MRFGRIGSYFGTELMHGHRKLIALLRCKRAAPAPQGGPKRWSRGRCVSP